MRSVGLHTNQPYVAVRQRIHVDIYRLFISASLPLRGLYRWFIEFLTYFLRLIPEHYYPKLLYPIEDEIISTTTRVIFTRSKHNKEPMCLKLWLRRNERVCNPQLVTRHMDYLLEGLEFNRRFAPGVYRGIASVELIQDEQKIRRGKLIEEPGKIRLKSGKDYALVMKRLDADWRLDHQLCYEGLGTTVGIEFLAREVALLHGQLEESPDGMGTSASITEKLELNMSLFEESLHELTHASHAIKKYRWISNLMFQSYERYSHLFEARYTNGRIKRCHGDLKATNLWVFPKKSWFFGLRKQGKKLVALDCVDFNPDFCHIDTLSDIAMLAIDIEMRLNNQQNKTTHVQHGQRIARRFLERYLQEVDETSEATWPLLEYYMTEKAMVCAYVSILYDKLPEQGESYLDVALVHARKLEKMLKHTEKLFASKQKTAPLLAASHSR